MTFAFSSLTTIVEASILFTTPCSCAMIMTPESRATLPSKPVPINGASGVIIGTVEHHVFDPMSARLASSFSKNGMSDVAPENGCFADTSMSDVSGMRQTDFSVDAGRLCCQGFFMFVRL